MLKRIDSYFAKAPRALILSLTLGVVGVLGVVDYATKAVIELDIFYVLPIAFATWFIGKRAGILTAISATLSWLIVNRSLHRYALIGLPVMWNIIVEFVFFLIIVLLLSELKSRLSLLEGQANRDPLTGVANRRAFYRLADAERLRCQRYGSPFTVAYIDLDDFKSVNDRFGHAAGDALLIKLARTLQRNTRVTDVVGRLGGDEFVVLLTETDGRQARLAVEKIEQFLGDALRTKQSLVTFSIGVVTFAEAPPSVDATLKQVDGLMYSVKNDGKNATRFADWPRLAA